jgi:hypothetical protein
LYLTAWQEKAILLVKNDSAASAAPVLSLESKVLAAAAWDILTVTLGGVKRETRVLSELATNRKPDAWRGLQTIRSCSCSSTGGWLQSVWEGPPAAKLALFLHD